MKNAKTPKALTLDRLTRELTAYHSFAELITECLDNSISPTLRGDGAETLAKSFDNVMGTLSSPLRAWRGE